MKRLAWLVLFFVAPVFGQLQIERFAKGPMPDNCVRMQSAASKLISSYPHPTQWLFVIACDDSSWDFMAGQTRHVLDADDIYGITMPKVKVTFLRGPALIHGTPGQPSAAHIVAHELAHIMLKTDDDIKADRVAAEWMADRGAFDSLSR